MGRGDYEKALSEVRACEEVITRCQLDDDVSVIQGQTKNFASSNHDEQLELVQCYRRALDFYGKSKKVDESLRLVDSLLKLVDTCSVGTINFAIQLLLAIEEKTIDGLKRIRPNLRQEVKARLRNARFNLLEEHELDFWLLRAAISRARNLAVVDPEELKAIDEFQIQILSLAAQASFAVRNLANTAACYEEAGAIAQQLGERKLAEELLQKASQVNLLVHRQAPSVGSIEHDLNQIIVAHINKIRSTQLLPTPEQMKQEYESVENKLETLLTDKRLTIDEAVVKAAIENYGDTGLLGWIPAADLDQYGNQRSDLREGEGELARQLEISYVMQIARVIDFLFLTWQETGHLIEEQIISLLLSSSIAEFDWTISKRGINSHFKGDYISSVHLLIPQFESILRKWAEKAAISVKKLDSNAKGTIWGEKLLNDLTHDPDVRDYLGSDLVKVIDWYLAVQPFSYRHKVAHGFIASEQCNSQLSAMVIWLTLVVATKPLLSKESNTL